MKLLTDGVNRITTEGEILPPMAKIDWKRPGAIYSLDDLCFHHTRALTT